MVENPNASKTEAKKKWNAANYDRLYIYVPKGERERLKAYAKSLGMSMNEYVNKQIFKGMKGGTEWK